MRAFAAVLEAGFAVISEGRGEDVRAVAGDVQVGVYPRRAGGYFMLIQRAGQRAHYEVAFDADIVRLYAFAALRGWDLAA